MIVGYKHKGKIFFEHGSYKGVVTGEGKHKGKHHFYLDDCSHLYLNYNDILPTTQRALDFIINENKTL